MRAKLIGLILSVAVLFPSLGTAQVNRFRTSAPEVTAASADWQITSDGVQGLIK
jgi:hypothetical protein